MSANILFSQGTWTQKANLTGNARQWASSFSISNKGYLGTGYAGGAYLNDFYEYDTLTNTWTQKANFLGIARHSCVAFSIGSKGYLGTGYESTNGAHNDWYEYDPVSDTWTQKNSMPTIGRSHAVGFCIGSKGYVGTGSSGGSLSDWWEYDPITDTWTQKTNFPVIRYSSFTFVIGDKGYVGGGYNTSTSSSENDFYEYDPSADTWTQKSNFSGGPINEAQGFTIGNKGYVATGFDSTGYAKRVWEYDPNTDIWTQVASFPFTPRRSATSFSFIDKGYIATGDGAYGVDYNDLAEFTFSTTAASGLIISNVISNNSSFPNPKVLWDGNTNQSPPKIKICADGSSATTIKFINQTGIDPNNIRFRTSSDPSGTNPELYGEFINYKVTGNMISAEYSHPKYLQSDYKPYRSDAVIIVDKSNSSPAIFSIPIQIYRAPVIMVHGLWGTTDTFTGMKGFLDASGYYPPDLTFIVNYFSTNANSFVSNANVVPIQINLLLSLCRINMFSAGRVDYIGHSMGGILGREYIQSIKYKSDIHKLITVNTPHSGTQTADFLRNPNYSIVGDIMRFYGNDDSKGAVDDLKTNSNAILDLYQHGLSTNYATVASHSICTYQSLYLSTFGWVSLLLQQELLAAGFLSVDLFLSSLFQYEENDLVVPISSQHGGLISPTSTLIDNQWHGSCDNPNVQAKVLSLLNEDPNSTSFNYTGFEPNPFPLPSIYLLKEGYDSVNYQKTATGKVTISNPITNSVFTPGQQIPINVSSTGTINHLTIIEGNPFLGVTLTDTAVSSASCNYTIPQNAIGRILITAVGSDNTGIVGYDTVSIIINVTAQLDSITCYPNEIVVSVNEKASLSLTGYFKDGIQRNLQSINNVQFLITDTTIASCQSSYIVYGKRIDSTTLSVSYKGITKIIPVYVFPEDTSIVKPNGIIPPPDNNFNTRNTLKVFPNPSHSIFVVHFEAPIGEQIDFEIFNQFGQRIFSQQDKAQSKTFIKEFSLNEFPAGIYLIRVLSKSINLEGKVLIY